jgi:uncharacterized phage protein (TIGR01671 family)
MTTREVVGMRQIKFRAWHKETKKMYPWEWIDEDNNIIVNLWKVLDSQQHENTDFVLMQYTGRQDNNSQDIYEGDICVAGLGNGSLSFKGVVEFYDSRFILKDISGYIPRDIKVIGNVYENPDLISHS